MPVSASVDWFLPDVLLAHLSLETVLLFWNLWNSLKFCVEVDLILAVHDGMKKNTDNIINDAGFS